jgi:hypothetical protein
MNAIFIRTNIDNKNLNVAQLKNKSVATTFKTDLNLHLNKKFGKNPQNLNILEEEYLSHNYQEEEEDECTEVIVSCICKCALAFLGGILISDMKFIKIGII